MNIDELLAEGLFFRAGSGNELYRTCLDGKVMPITRIELPQTIAESFLDSKYETYRVTEPLLLYRTFGTSPYSEKQLPDYVLEKYCKRKNITFDRSALIDSELISDPGFVRTICDHISGMTDQFAAREYLRLYVPEYA